MMRWLLIALLALPCYSYQPRLAPLRTARVGAARYQAHPVLVAPEVAEEPIDATGVEAELVVEEAAAPSLLAQRLPILSWAPKLNTSTAVGDVIAGITVATMLIPQGMSYATIAGLHPIVGLYCYVPLLVYALMGTSRYISVGPVALVSTTLYGMVATQTGAAKLALASALMFWGGVLSTILGLLGLGFVLEIVPHDVLSAFTTCAAFNIMITQLGSLFQISVASSHAPIIMLRNALVALPSAKLFTSCFSAAAIGMLIALKRLPIHSWLKLPASVPKSIVGSLGPFLTMVVFTLINGAFGLSASQGLQEVGIVPSGLPKFTPAITHPDLTKHFKDIAVITFVFLTETLAMGKALAERAGEKISNSQEFIAMGVANTLGSFFQSYPSAGSFSRSAVVVSTGGTSQLAGIVTAASVVMVLTFLTPYFTHVPKAVLAACLIVAVAGLVDKARIGELWRENKFDFGLYMVYAAAMLTFGAAEGLMASVVVYYAVEAAKKLGSRLRGKTA